MEAKDLTRKRKPYRSHYWRYMDYILGHKGLEGYVVRYDFLTGEIIEPNRRVKK